MELYNELFIEHDIDFVILLSRRILNFAMLLFEDIYLLYIFGCNYFGYLVGFIKPLVFIKDHTH